MPFNGSGTFSRLYSWVVDAANSVNISSTRTDAELNGFAAGLTNCITRDGQSPPSADIPWGAKRLTNLAAASAGTDALNRDTADARYLASGSALPHTITFNNAGSGAASGAVFDVTANITVSFNTLGAAPLASPTFTGTPAAPTAAPGTNTTQLATTAFVTAAIPSLSTYAPLASPALTGTPTAPTAAVGTNTTQLATTAFVQAARPTFPGNVSASFTAADADNNTHKVASGAAQTLTLGSITAGTAFTIRFTTAWSLAVAGGLSKNGAAPGGVTTGTIAANSLITFLHEGSGVWDASGAGLS